MNKKVTTAIAAGIVATTIGVAGLTGVQAEEGDLNPASHSLVGTSIFQRAAQILGISEDELSDAFKGAQMEEIDEKVADGTMDEDKAEEMKSRIEESEYPMMGGMMRGGHGHGMEKHIADLSEFLGVSEDELEGLHEEGLSTEDILEKYGKTQDEFHEFITDKYGDEPPPGPLHGPWEESEE